MTLALMPKICVKYPILGDFLNDFCDLWNPDMTPYPTPKNYYSIFGTLNHVCKTEMGDMAIMPKMCWKKISIFSVIFGAFFYSSRHPFLITGH